MVFVCCGSCVWLFPHKLKYQIAPSVFSKVTDAVTSCGLSVSVSSFEYEQIITSMTPMAWSSQGV